MLPIDYFTLETQKSEAIPCLNIQRSQQRSSCESHVSFNFFYHPLYIVFHRYGHSYVVFVYPRRQIAIDVWIDNRILISLLSLLNPNSNKQSAEIILFAGSAKIKVS